LSPSSRRLFGFLLRTIVLVVFFVYTDATKAHFKEPLLLHLPKELLSMGSGLRARPGANILLYGVPVFTKFLESLQKPNVFFIGPFSGIEILEHFIGVRLYLEGRFLIRL